MKLFHIAVMVALVTGLGWSGSASAQAHKDTDGDKIPDACEIEMNLDPNDPTDAEGDMDADGFTELQEFRAKTDITNADSRPGTGKRDFKYECLGS